MSSAFNRAHEFRRRASEMTMAEITDLICSHQQLEDEVIALRHQVAWFQKQLFGQKSERRIIETPSVQGTLGLAFDELSDAPATSRKRRIDAYERRTTKGTASAEIHDESPLFFDE